MDYMFASLTYSISSRASPFLADTPCRSQAARFLSLRGSDICPTSSNRPSHAQDIQISDPYGVLGSCTFASFLVQRDDA